MTKHTPGPWTMHPRGKDGAEVRAITSVAWCGSASTFGPSGSQVIRADEAQANARLIAAAPDLLAACKALVQVAWWHRSESTLSQARRAIEKARGAGADGPESTEDDVEDVEDAEVVSYTLYGTTSGLQDQDVIESRTRVATRDADSEWWGLRRKSRAARARKRPYSDWEYEELLATGTSVTDEAAAIHWVVEGRLR